MTQSNPLLEFPDVALRLYMARYSESSASARVNITRLARFLKSLRPENEVDLLPYHRLGISKYEMFGREYQQNNR